MPAIRPFFDPDTATVTYLVWDEATRKAAIIDPVLDFNPNSGAVTDASANTVLKAVDDLDLDLEWVLETHAHADHMTAGDLIRKQTGAKIGIGAHITKVQSVFKDMFEAEDVAPDGSVFDALFEDGAEFSIGETPVRVLHTPGHTPACITYVIGDAAFVGDTLFMPDFGTARTDFPGGDAATIFRSIHRILELPAETRIFVGHDYPPEGRLAPAWETTVAEERRANIHVHEGVTEADYVAMREARDATLDAPRLLLPSLQVNIRAGALPPAVPSGKRFLKLPVRSDLE